MPSRPNPYYTSPDTYGSRNLAPAGNFSHDSLALPLAQLAGTIAEALTYDPANDPRAIEARANKLKIDQAHDRDVVMGQVRQSINDPTVSLGDLASSALTYGHMKPEDAGKVALLANAARGRGDQSMDDALSDSGLWELAAGTPGGSTFNASTYGSRKKPTEVIESGKSVLRAAEDAYGATPVLEESKVKGNMLGDLAASLTDTEKKQVVGANPPQRTPYNVYDADGNVTSTVDPASLVGPGKTVSTATVNATNPSGLTNGNKTNVQGAQIALQHFQDLVKMAREIAGKDPTLFGVTGEARRGLQEVNQQLGNLRLMTGSQANDLDGIYQDTLAKMAADGIQVPGAAYDPNLSDIRKLSVLMRYAGAAALAGQQGRSVSNEDVKTFTGVVGDPGSWLSSQQQYLSGLDLMDKIANQMSTRNAAALAPGKPAPTVAGIPAAPAAAPAPAAPQFSEGQTATGPNGEKIVFRNGQWMPR